MSHLKTLLFLAAGIFSLAILPSCNDDEAVDPCLNVVIPECWICQDGQLVQVDLCAGVNCPTGFTCVNGNCIEDEPTVTHVGLITADETWSGVCSTKYLISRAEVRSRLGGGTSHIQYST